MNNLFTIKRRITGAKSVLGLVRSMELISSSKFRSFKDKLLLINPFLEGVTEMFKYMKYNPQGGQLTLMLASNEGLCSSFNINLSKILDESFRGQEIMIYGKRAADLIQGKEIKYKVLESIDVEKISERILNGEIGKVNIIFAEYLSGKITFKDHTIFPYKQEEYLGIIESDNIYQKMLNVYIKACINQAFISTRTSENCIRLRSMTSAKKNAEELISDLQLHYNKDRQSSITKEILEIISSAEGGF